MTREEAQQKFRKRISGKFLFSLFILRRLPLAFIAGVRLQKLDKESCSVSVPYKWLSQNPFRSIYFAAQAMAAEMSTGILSLAAIEGYDPPLSMLVTQLEAEFVKKADISVVFSCENGKEIQDAVDQAVSGNDGVTVKARSEGRTADGTVVAIFHITWSFKKRIKK